MPGGAQPAQHDVRARAGPGDVRPGQRAPSWPPQKVDDTLAFMFETRWMIVPTRQAMEAAHLQRDYDEVWAGLAPSFAAPRASR